MEPTERLESLLVSDVMSRAVTSIAASNDMDVAAATLNENSISSAPVTDEAGRTIGILSATDFLRRNCTVDSHALGQTDGGEPVQMEEVPDRAISYMSDAIQAVGADDTLLHAAKIMVDTHLHRLPVMESQRTIGMISTMDVVSALLKVIDERRPFGPD